MATKKNATTAQNAVTEETTQQVETTVEETHSEMFNELNFKYEMGYVTISNLRMRVKLGKKVPAKGITEAEFEQITGIPYSV